MFQSQYSLNTKKEDITIVEPEQENRKVKDPPIDLAEQTNNDGTSEPVPKKRKVKDLPAELSSLTNKDKEKFEVILEIDNNPKSETFGNEFYTAQSVRLQSTSSSTDSVDDLFDLKGLTIDQLRKLCKKLGIANCGSHNKFNCRRAIATFFRYQDAFEKSGMKPTSRAASRATTVVLKNERIEDCKIVKDDTIRNDNETINANTALMIGTALANNSIMACNSGNKATEEVVLQHPTKSVTDTVASSNSRKTTDSKSTVDDNYTTTPTSKATKIKRSKDTKTDIIRPTRGKYTTTNTPKGATTTAQDTAQGIIIDSYFQPFIDITMRGDASVSLLDEEAEKGFENSRRRVRKEKDASYSILQNFLQQGQVLLQHLTKATEEIKKATEEHKRAALADRKKTKFHVRLEVAKALGDIDELKKLMEEAKSMDTND